MSDDTDHLAMAIKIAHAHGYVDADIAQLELARGRATVSNQQEELASLRSALDAARDALKEIMQNANTGSCDCECDDMLTGEEMHALSCPVTIDRRAAAALAKLDELKG